MIFVEILLIVFLVFLLIAFVFATKVIYPKRFGVQETYEIEKENGKIDEKSFDSWQKEEILLKSPFGYELFGFWFPEKQSKRTVILSHGITYTLYGSVKYMKMFKNLGFNIFIYDNRHHGRSGGSNATFGFHEKYDLKVITDWVESKTGSDALIGTHGESMGAAISLQHAAIDSRIKFVVEDCSFNRLDTLLEFRLKVDYHLPRLPLMPVVQLFCYALSGMDISKVAPETAVSEIDRPIMFIHGEKDEFIPPFMAQKLFTNKTHGPKKLYIARNAGHAESYWTNQEEYTSQVTEFLKENNLIF